MPIDVSWRNPYLIWKWHPAGTQSGDNNRENAIRRGSSLQVRDAEVAVFVYHQKNGPMQEFVVGPYEQVIKTENFPILVSIVGLAYEGGDPVSGRNLFHQFGQNYSGQVWCAVL